MSATTAPTPPTSWDEALDLAEQLFDANGHPAADRRAPKFWTDAALELVAATALQLGRRGVEPTGPALAQALARPTATSTSTSRSRVGSRTDEAVTATAYVVLTHEPALDVDVEAGPTS